MDVIAKNNRDVDSNPRGVLGSCVDAGLSGWLAVISSRCCNRGRAHGRASCQMTHPDPLALWWPIERRAGVGFIPPTVQLGTPVSLPGASGITLRAALLGWNMVVGLEKEEEDDDEGQRMAQVQGRQEGKGSFCPSPSLCSLEQGGTAQTRRLRHRCSQKPLDHTCTAPRSCCAAPGFGLSLVLCREVHQDLLPFTPWSRGAGAPRCPQCSLGQPHHPQF